MARRDHGYEKIDAFRREGRWKDLVPLADGIKSEQSSDAQALAFRLTLLAEMILHKVPAQYGRSLSAAALDQLKQALVASPMFEDAVALGVLVAQARLIKYEGATAGASCIPVDQPTRRRLGGRHARPDNFLPACNTQHTRWTPLAHASRPRTVSAAGAAVAASVLLRGLRTVSSATASSTSTSAGPAAHASTPADPVPLRSCYRRRLWSQAMLACGEALLLEGIFGGTGGGGGPHGRGDGTASGGQGIGGDAMRREDSPTASPSGPRGGEGKGEGKSKGQDKGADKGKGKGKGKEGRAPGPSGCALLQLLRISGVMSAVGLHDDASAARPGPDRVGVSSSSPCGLRLDVDVRACLGGGARGSQRAVLAAQACAELGMRCLGAVVEAQAAFGMQKLELGAELLPRLMARGAGGDTGGAVDGVEEEGGRYPPGREQTREQGVRPGAHTTSRSAQLQLTAMHAARMLEVAGADAARAVLDEDPPSYAALLAAGCSIVSAARSCGSHAASAAAASALLSPAGMLSPLKEPAAGTTARQTAVAVGGARLPAALRQQIGGWCYVSKAGVPMAVFDCDPGSFGGGTDAGSCATAWPRLSAFGCAGRKHGPGYGPACLLRALLEDEDGTSDRDAGERGGGGSRAAGTGNDLVAPSTSEETDSVDVEALLGPDPASAVFGPELATMLQAVRFPMGGHSLRRQLRARAGEREGEQDTAKKSSEGAGGKKQKDKKGGGRVSAESRQGGELVFVGRAMGAAVVMQPPDLYASAGGGHPESADGEGGDDGGASGADRLALLAGGSDGAASSSSGWFGDGLGDRMKQVFDQARGKQHGLEAYTAPVWPPVHSLWAVRAALRATLDGEPEFGNAVGGGGGQGLASGQGTASAEGEAGSGKGGGPASSSGKAGSGSSASSDATAKLDSPCGAVIEAMLQAEAVSALAAMAREACVTRETRGVCEWACADAALLPPLLAWSRPTADSRELIAVLGAGLTARFVPRVRPSFLSTGPLLLAACSTGNDAGQGRGQPDSVEARSGAAVAPAASTSGAGSRGGSAPGTRLRHGSMQRAADLVVGLEESLGGASAGGCVRAADRVRESVIGGVPTMLVLEGFRGGVPTRGAGAGALSAEDARLAESLGQLPMDPDPRACAAVSSCMLHACSKLPGSSPSAVAALGDVLRLMTGQDTPPVTLLVCAGDADDLAQETGIRALSVPLEALRGANASPGPEAGPPSSAGGSQEEAKEPEVGSTSGAPHAGTSWRPQGENNLRAAQLARGLSALLVAAPASVAMGAVTDMVRPPGGDHGEEEPAADSGELPPDGAVDSEPQSDSEGLPEAALAGVIGPGGALGLRPDPADAASSSTGGSSGAEPDGVSLGEQHSSHRPFAVGFFGALRAAAAATGVAACQDQSSSGYAGSGPGPGPGLGPGPGPRLVPLSVLLACAAEALLACPVIDDGAATVTVQRCLPGAAAGSGGHSPTNAATWLAERACEAAAAMDGPALAVACGSIDACRAAVAATMPRHAQRRGLLAWAAAAVAQTEAWVCRHRAQCLLLAARCYRRQAAISLLPGAVPHLLCREGREREAMRLHALCLEASTLGLAWLGETGPGSASLPSRTGEEQHGGAGADPLACRLQVLAAGARMQLAGEDRKLALGAGSTMRWLRSSLAAWPEQADAWALAARATAMLRSAATGDPRSDPAAAEAHMGTLRGGVARIQAACSALGAVLGIGGAPATEEGGEQVGEPVDGEDGGSRPRGEGRAGTAWSLADSGAISGEWLRGQASAGQDGTGRVGAPGAPLYMRLEEALGMMAASAAGTVGQVPMGQAPGVDVLGWAVLGAAAESGARARERKARGAKRTPREQIHLGEQADALGRVAAAGMMAVKLRGEDGKRDAGGGDKPVGVQGVAELADVVVRRLDLSKGGQGCDDEMLVAVIGLLGEMQGVA